LTFTISCLLSQNQFKVEATQVIRKVRPHKPVMDVICIKLRLSCVCANEPHEPAIGFDAAVRYSIRTDTIGKIKVAANPLILFDDHLSTTKGIRIETLPETMII
jgi:hypothetical protein